MCKDQIGIRISMSVGSRCAIENLETWFPERKHPPTANQEVGRHKRQPRTVDLTQHPQETHPLMLAQLKAEDQGTLSSVKASAYRPHLRAKW